jgi:hypothetical protein
VPKGLTVACIAALFAAGVLFGGTVLGGSLPLLRCALAPHRRVAHHIPGRLLAATEQLVE